MNEDSFDGLLDWRSNRHISTIDEMLTDEEIERKAKLGYEAYGAFTEWKNYASYQCAMD